LPRKRGQQRERGNRVKMGKTKRAGHNRRSLPVYFVRWKKETRKRERGGDAGEESGSPLFLLGKEWNVLFFLVKVKKGRKGEPRLGPQ